MPGENIRVGLGLAAILLVADQITKMAVLNLFLGSPHVVPVTPFFNLVLVWNSGVSFGMLAGSGEVRMLVLIGFALVVALVLAVWLARTGSNWVVMSLGLIIGGAVGNVIDRLRFGAVIDFLQFYWRDWYFPAFNLADSAITLGVIGLLLQSLIEKPRTARVSNR